jgi:hypothetical protein
MTVKICLAKGEVQGNLRTAKQSYYIHFLPRVVQDGKIVYLDKVEFALLTPSVKGSDEPIYRSLRFDDPAQLYLFILDLCKAHAFFKKAKGELSEFNIQYYQADLSRKFLQIEKDVLRGVFDGGI